MSLTTLYVLAYSSFTAFLSILATTFYFSGLYAFSFLDTYTIMLSPILNPLQTFGRDFLTFQVWPASGVGHTYYRTTLMALTVLDDCTYAFTQVSMQLCCRKRHSRQTYARSYCITLTPLHLHPRRNNSGPCSTHYILCPQPQLYSQVNPLG
jgi:hypothetical protein